MGIQGLLPFLKKIHKPVNLAEFGGCTVAVDAYCWLHKGAFSCADKLALGEKTDQYVYYCMKYLEFMLKNNIKPVMVFDGCHLPSKKDVEKTRREKRDMYRKKAAQLLREGKRGEARECLQRCIDISPDMALQLMNTCRARGIDCIVAPYEADAQLAYLNKSGIAQIIITEDSDLLLFGCEKVIFKMDHFGNGILIEKSRLNEVLDINSGVYSFERFRYMCILSGCDYLPSLPGIGLVKAGKVFKMARQTDLKQLLKKFPTTYLKMSLAVPAEYIEGFIKANNTFLYQLVFNPLKRELVPLNTYPDDINRDELHYAGPHIEPGKALQIALGNINIYTGEKFADFRPDGFVPTKSNKKAVDCLHQLSIWNKDYRVRPNVEMREIKNAQRPNLKGEEKKCFVKFPRKSPVKRLRPAEECREAKSDVELSDLYNLATSTESPQRKKYRADVESSENKNILRSYSSECAQTEEEEVDETEDRLQHTQNNRKAFISSLTEADQEVSKDMSACQGIVPIETQKENILSPRKNRFAVVSANKKPRFDVNARKEVKSRFFVTSPSNTSTSKAEENVSDITEMSKNSPVEQSEIQNGNDLLKSTSGSPKFKSSSPQTKSLNVKKSSSPCKTFKKSPSESAFSWSKFKFSRNDITSKSSPCGTPQRTASPVFSQFKKVISDPNRTHSFNKTVAGDSDSSSQQSIVDEEYEDGDGDVANSQMSPADSYCSIDSFCLGSSQGSQSSLLGSKNEDVMFSSCSTLSSQDSSLSQVKMQDTLSLRSDGVKGRGGCRVSGLTKSGKSKRKNSENSKQPSVKDMFSRFAHSKSNLAKLQKSHSTESGDLTDSKMTPSHDRSAFTVLEGVQRKLLP